MTPPPSQPVGAGDPDADRAAARSGRHGGLITLLTALTAIGPLATGIYLPSLPAIVEDFDTDVGMVQLTLTVYLAGFALAHLVYGPLADRYGRRPLLLGGLMLFAVASVACAFAPSIEFLIAVRLLQSLGASAGPVIGRAIVRDLFEHHEVARVMAWIGTALALAPAAAPVVGGYLEVWLGWRSTFIVTSFYGLVLVALVGWRLKESTRALRVHDRFLAGATADYLALLRQPAFLGNTAIVGFGFGALFAFQAGAPIAVINLIGLSPDLYGLYSTVAVAGYAAGSYAAGKLAASVEHGRVIRWGVLTSTAGGCGLAAFALAGHLSLLAIYGPITVYALGMGLFMPFAFAAAVKPFPHMAGSASAMIGFLQTGLGAVGSLLVVPFPSETQLPMALSVAAMTLASLLTLVALRRWQRAQARR